MFFLRQAVATAHPEAVEIQKTFLDLLDIITFRQLLGLAQCTGWLVHDITCKHNMPATKRTMGTMVKWPTQTHIVDASVC